MELINEKFLSLVGKRRNIADALLKDSQRFLFMDIEKIAKELGTTPSTLSRVIRAIGFLSFKDFRSWIAKELGLIVEPDEFEISKDEVLLQDELKGMEANFSLSVLKRIEEAASIIAAKESIIIASFGISNVLSELFKMYLEFTNLKIEVTKNSFTEAVLAYHSFGKNTVLFLIDLFVPFKEGLNLLKSFKEKGVPRISLTALSFSQIGMLSSLVIPVKVKRRYLIPPMASAVSIIDLIALKITTLRKKETQAKFKIFKRAWKDKELFLGG